MVIRVSSLESLQDRRGSYLRLEEQYPFLDMMRDGRVFELTLGEDIKIPKRQFQTYCHIVAKRYGYRAVTRSQPPNILLVQFIWEGGEPTVSANIL
jgi:hypothetical protein